MKITWTMMVKLSTKYFAPWPLASITAYVNSLALNQTSVPTSRYFDSLFLTADLAVSGLKDYFTLLKYSIGFRAQGGPFKNRPVLLFFLFSYQPFLGAFSHLLWLFILLQDQRPETEIKLLKSLRYFCLQDAFIALRLHCARCNKAAPKT